MCLFNPFEVCCTFSSPHFLGRGLLCLCQQEPSALCPIPLLSAATVNYDRTFFSPPHRAHSQPRIVDSPSHTYLAHPKSLFPQPHALIFWEVLVLLFVSKLDVFMLSWFRPSLLALVCLSFALEFLPPLPLFFPPCFGY